ncbi:Pyridoxal phosphate-dependent transferase, major region, subdomain 1 [Niveomyces insectorum RCEF 264]|uniref:Pyridoxal phosphate-dependent transferase, major region, subdomain 1 n=1 Tax=Niveomyces insectorum RCEF 264 TaxID=1081102 RepID=A0A167MKR5_9HYPO|nr:Pyridoxal phosphate-dependent transferase, major region, subdomain 1 [Niveomyces insectorum RCEF 264]
MVSPEHPGTTDVTVSPAAETGSRFLSTCEVEECIRRVSPVLHPLISLVGRVAPEIMSPYDVAGDAVLDGFALRPSTLPDFESSVAFSTRVYETWIRHGGLTYDGTALPGISYAEATGRFRLDTAEPGPFSGRYFVDKAGLWRTLSSLVDVALSEAVKQHLTEGGDERLHLQPFPDDVGGGNGTGSGGIGVNKYYCPPHPVSHGTVVRSSCTCSPPSVAGFEAARRCLAALWNGSLSAEKAFDVIRNRISAILGVQTAHHVVLHPSGTDAEFTALLIGLNQARSLGRTGVVSIVVGAKEAAAVDGSDLRDGVRVVQLAARRDDGSTIADFDALVMQTLRAAADDVGAAPHEQEHKPFFIVHAVDGSKLGSHITSRSLVEQIRAQYGDDRVLFVLDACQARTDRDELDWYLSRNAVVLITGSKFYGAPGFCAAALVPHAAAAAGQLIVSAREHGVGTGRHRLGCYITQLEVPAELDALRNALPAGPVNVGLLLRWTCGVAEMERFARAQQAGRQAIRQWVGRARALIHARKPYFQLLGDDGCNDNDGANGGPATATATFVGGVNSIISFGLRRQANGPRLDAAALRCLHRWLTMDIARLLPATATEAERRTAKSKCFVGQPVDLGDMAVLRLAMGASLASDIAEGSRCLDDVLADDGRVLDKLVLSIKYWDALRDGKSG